MENAQINTVYQTHLSNGIRLLVLPVEGSKSSVIYVGFAAGAFYEEGFGTGSNDGISHFLEHMIFKGTPNISSSEINEKFTRLGAETNAFTNYDRTVYYSKVPAKNLYAAIDIWSELFINFTLVPEEFNSEKKVIMQEIKMYEDQPNLYCGWKSRANLYKGTPLAHDIGGTQESVSGITESMMEQYHSRYYAPENTTIIISGNVQKSKISELIESRFNQQIARKIGKDTSWHDFPSSWKSNFEYFTHPSKQALSYIGVSWELPGVTTEHYYPVILLNKLIGNSKTSFLYKELVSKGICSTVSYAPDFFPPRSSGTITYSCPPDQVAKIYTTIYKEIFENLQALSITPDLVQKLKDEIKGRMIMAIDDPLISVSNLHHRFINQNEIIPHEEALKRITYVTVEEIKNALTTSFNDITFSVYAMGAIPEDWAPVLHLS